MYKLLLIWRYLLTRRIAYASVISVTLGVASMIVVNAVMLGFSREMQDRIHGALSDVTISSRSTLRGFDIRSSVTKCFTVCSRCESSVRKKAG